MHAASKNMAGKSREELALEKQMELERRLMDVSGQLNSGKKPPKTKRKSSALLSSRVKIIKCSLRVQIFKIRLWGCTY